MHHIARPSIVYPLNILKATTGLAVTVCQTVLHTFTSWYHRRTEYTQFLSGKHISMGRWKGFCRLSEWTLEYKYIIWTWSLNVAYASHSRFGMGMHALSVFAWRQRLWRRPDMHTRRNLMEVVCSIGLATLWGMRGYARDRDVCLQLCRMRLCTRTLLYSAWLQHIYYSFHWKYKIRKMYKYNENIRA